jgi:hypothetical protein
MSYNGIFADYGVVLRATMYDTAILNIAAVA